VKRILEGRDYEKRIEQRTTRRAPPEQETDHGLDP